MWPSPFTVGQPKIFFSFLPLVSSLSSSWMLFSKYFTKNGFLKTSFLFVHIVLKQIVEFIKAVIFNHSA